VFPAVSVPWNLTLIVAPEWSGWSFDAADAGTLIVAVSVPAAENATLADPRLTVLGLWCFFFLTVVEAERLTLPASDIVTDTFSFLDLISYLIVDFAIVALTVGGVVSSVVND
jgi:hypothetical protein